jgi:molybdopterin converting factor small subunit
MAIRIESFGQLSEITGKEFEADVKDTDQLTALLRDQYKVPGNIKYMLAVNRKLVTANTALNATDTVALLPPYSGG